MKTIAIIRNNLFIINLITIISNNLKNIIEKIHFLN